MYLFCKFNVASLILMITSSTTVYIAISQHNIKDQSYRVLACYNQKGTVSMYANSNQGRQ